MHVNKTVAKSLSRPLLNENIIRYDIRKLW